jgi:hypothetical protein
MDPSAVKAENKDQHPYTIVRATQFFEFVKQIVDYPTEGNTVRMPAALIQPMAADDVTSEVARIATNTAVNGTVEIGGPEQSRLDDLARIAGLRHFRKLCRLWMAILRGEKTYGATLWG